MPITKTGASLTKEGNSLLWRGIKYLDLPQHALNATLATGRTASKGTKGVGRAARWAGEKTYQGGKRVGKAIIGKSLKHETLRNSLLAGAAVTGYGAYRLPERVKANMIHVDPNSQNYTVGGLKGYRFATPELRAAAKNTRMIF